IGRVEDDVLQCELYLALSQHGHLVRSDEAHALRELADTSGPAVEQAQFERHHRYLRNANEVQHADQEKVAVGFLPDFFAQQRALQVRQNSGRLHNSMEFQEASTEAGEVVFFREDISAARTVFCISMAMVIGPT